MEYLLGIGANLGDRRKNLQIAFNKLAEESPEISWSAIYEFPALLPYNIEDTEEWDKHYYNMVVKGKFNYSPMEMIDFVKSIEKEMGRQTTERWAPREIDIDILLAEEEIIEEGEKLIIPHQHMLDRDFVLIPACDIAAHWVHPVTGQTLQDHLDDIESDEYKIIGKINCKS